MEQNENTRVEDSRPSFPLDARRRRILFRATHRGTHETDVLIGGFVEARIVSMNDHELDAIEAVMELPDVDLADWLTGRRPVPANVQTPMLNAMVSDAANPERLARIRSGQ